MILGILSDTHGRRERAAEALRVLRAAGAESVVHCGDVGDAGVIEELAGWRAWLVWGNCDRADPALPCPSRTYSRGLAALAGSLGLTVAHQVPLLIRLDGVALAVFHGHEPQFARIERFVETGNLALLGAELRDCRYILHGHSHQRRDQRIGHVRIVNPGALHRATAYTAATLDLASDELSFWEVLDGAGGQPPVRYFPGPAPLSP